MPDQRIEVACVSNAAYLPHCAAMLASLLAFNTGAQLRIRLLCSTDVTGEQRRTLEKWLLKQDVELACVDPAQIRLPSDLPGLARLTNLTWFRIRLPELLPEVERLIYLDVDMVVQGSLRELWQVDLSGNAVAAVTDTPQAHIDPGPIFALGVPELGAYFNAGVLVMDLAAWRRDDITGRMLRFTAEHPQLIRYADQDAMNAVLWSRRLPLHLRWNAQSPLFEGEKAAMPFSALELQEARQNPAIVHYSGNWKPWHHRSRHPLRGLYADYRKRTPWADWEVEGRTLKHRLLRLVPESMARALTEVYWRTRTSIGLGG